MEDEPPAPPLRLVNFVSEEQVIPRSLSPLLKTLALHPTFSQFFGYPTLDSVLLYALQLVNAKRTRGERVEDGTAQRDRPLFEVGPFRPIAVLLVVISRRLWSCLMFLFFMILYARKWVAFTLIWLAFCVNFRNLCNCFNLVKCCKKICNRIYSYLVIQIRKTSCGES